MGRYASGMSITFHPAALAHATGGTFYDPARHELIDSNLWVSAVRKAQRENKRLRS